MALAERMLAARFNDDGHEIVDHHTFVIASDGDIQEGISSEASSLAGHLGLGRLIAFYDDNKIQLAGPTSLDFSEDVEERYDAYDWHVQNLGEDMSLERLEEATREAMAVEDRPSLIIVRSHIGYGSPHKQDTSGGARLAARRGRGPAHQGGLRLGSGQALLRPGGGAGALPPGGRARRELEAEWQERFDAYREAFPEKAALLEMIDADADARRLGPRAAALRRRAPIRSPPARPPRR